MYIYLSDRYVDLWLIFCAKFSLKKVVAAHTQSLSFHPYFLFYFIFFQAWRTTNKHRVNRLTFGWEDLDPVNKKKTNLIQPRPQGAFPWLWGRHAPKAREKRPGDEVEPCRDSQRRYLLAHPDFCWDNLIWEAVIVREIEGLLIRVKKKKHAKNRQTPWENLFASDQQNISNSDSHRGKTNVIIMSVSSVKIIRISNEYHW